MKIYTFGCSYSNGEEILYHRLGDLDLERKKLTSPSCFFKKIKEDDNLSRLYKEIKKEQLLYSWPNIFSNLKNIECINLSQSGNSLDKILWQILNHKFNDDDMILIGLTKPDRNLFFKDTYPMSFILNDLNNPEKNITTGVAEDGDEDILIDNTFDRIILNWFNDDRIIWDYIKTLKTILSLPYNIKLVPAMDFDLSDYHLKSYNDKLKELVKDIKEKYVTTKTLDEFSIKKHAWGHPEAEAHKKYAEHLYEVLR